MVKRQTRHNRSKRHTRHNRSKRHTRHNRSKRHTRKMKGGVWEYLFPQEGKRFQQRNYNTISWRRLSNDELINTYIELSKISPNDMKFLQSKQLYIEVTITGDGWKVRLVPMISLRDTSTQENAKVQRTLNAIQEAEELSGKKYALVQLRNEFDNRTVYRGYEPDTDSNSDSNVEENPVAVSANANNVLINRIVGRFPEEEYELYKNTSFENAKNSIKSVLLPGENSSNKVLRSVYNRIQTKLTQEPSNV
jgi:hypothetical protein